MNALWTGEALAKATGGALTPGGAGIEVNAVAIDTRTLEPGALFVALRGESDGHAHVADAFARGAACAMVHADAGTSGAVRIADRPDASPASDATRPPRVSDQTDPSRVSDTPGPPRVSDTPGPPRVSDTMPQSRVADTTCVLRVPDTTSGLAALGRAGRARFRGRVVAVTGSVGKTTTKEMLRLALGAFGPTHVAEASHNNHWGVPLTFARLPERHAFAVAEIGTNHPGEIASLAGLAAPHVAIVTAIGASHLGHFGSRDAIAREKAAIYAALGPDGVAIVPIDVPEAELLRASVPPHATVLGFGRSTAAAVRLVGTETTDGATHVEAVIDENTIGFTVGALGGHMVSNALAVLAAVHALGLDPARAAAALAAFRPGAGRGLARPILGGVATLLDESYNASASSVRAAFEVLSLLPARRRIAFLGDMLELGTFAESEHRGLADAAAAADLVHTCGPLSRALHEALSPEHRGVWAADAEGLAAAAPALVRPGDAVLVKGSNGSRMRLVVAALTDHTA